MERCKKKKREMLKEGTSDEQRYLQKKNTKYVIKKNIYVLF